MKRTSATCARCGVALQGSDSFLGRLIRQRLRGEVDVCPTCYVAIVLKVTGVTYSVTTPNAFLSQKSDRSSDV